MGKAFPKEFKERLQQQLQGGMDAYLKALETQAPVSLRVNPKKISQSLPFERISWSPEGYYLPERPIFTFDPVFQAGGYYVQEASSMFLGWAMNHLERAGERLKVLDLCAAPGGKSTHLVSLLSDNDLLVSNEIIKSRVGVLKENIEKWGYPNVVITNNDPENFEVLEGFFDIIVTDAPCSGEGLFRKDPQAVNEWSEANVQLCSRRQQRILVSAVKALKPGGHLIYSTCTHSPEENENNVKWMCDEFGLEEIKIPLPQGSGIEESRHGYRFYPHKVKGEGFYCAVLKKKGGSEATYRIKKPLFSALRKGTEPIDRYLQEGAHQAVYETNGNYFFFPESHFETLNILAENLRVVNAGTEAGTLIKGELIPAQALAHSVHLKKWRFEEIEISQADAIAFMRKEPFPLAPTTQGWKLITYKNLGLGFIKNLGNRHNNYFPKERRILKQPGDGELFSLLR